MNKYLIVVVVSVLALTGCNSEEKLLLKCYAESESTAEKDILLYKKLEANRKIIQKKTLRTIHTPFDMDERIAEVVEKYGVSPEGYITQTGRDRCKRLIELGEYP